MQDPKIQAHLFVCTNDRGPNAKRESCCAKGAAEIREALKRASHEKGFPAGSVRVNNAGCLDQCERGVAAVLYPKGEWFFGLTMQDVPKVISAMEEALKSK